MKYREKSVLLQFMEENRTFIHPLAGLMPEKNLFTKRFLSIKMVAWNSPATVSMLTSVSHKTTEKTRQKVFQAR